MIKDFFDKALHYLGNNEKNIFLVNIGAMDGVLFDELIGYTKTYNFEGLYVEPIPYLFQKLVENLGKNNKFENSAISDYDGTIKMIQIDQFAIDQKIVHECFYGMSAVYPPKNGLGSEGDKETVKKYGKTINVPCIRLESLLEKHNINHFDILKIDAEGHDYTIFKQIDFKKYKPRLLRIEFINLSSDEQNNIKKILTNNNYIFKIEGQDITAIQKIFYDQLFQKNNEEILTIVTGLWNIGREDLEGEHWNRSYKHYLEKFSELLEIEENLIIFGEDDLKELVFSKRNESNTQFITRGKEWFHRALPYEKIQEIRNDPKWQNKAPWLKFSTQAKLEYYNPLVMSKVFLMHDAKIMDKFDSTHMFWIDAGITNTVHKGYFAHDKVLQKLNKLDKITFVAFPYKANNEIHGFDYKRMCEMCYGEKVNKVCRGGFFGGPKDEITNFNSQYYGLLESTLFDGLMGTEESLFTMLAYKYPEVYDYFMIESNGLLGKFFEDVKNDRHILCNENSQEVKNTLDKTNTALYVITFNSPNQLSSLFESMEKYDKNFLLRPKIFVLNNSTDESTTPDYEQICIKYNATHIKKDNLGICGGRQFIAEHAEENGFDFHFFFEDDMLFYAGENKPCKVGFNRIVKNLYNISLNIAKNKNLDFLKLSFSEFYGDNSVQWAWYNVPQDVRESRWPKKNKLPERGVDPTSPKTEFKNIECHSKISFATGEIYYCNWPQVVSKHGNRKMFLETKWERPHEQTWMSHIYQKTLEGTINPAVLLVSPIEHNRFEHYPKELRKES